MDNKIYYIWMQKVLGVASRKAREVLDYFGSAEKFAKSGEKERRLSGLFNQREIVRIGNTPIEYAEDVINKCEKTNQQIITCDDVRYPVRLTRLIDAPLVIYVLGTLPTIDDEVAVAVVGTRSATPYGHKTAFRLSYRLAECGALIVSGGAVGIDSEAHRGALQAGGRTIAVLGCGIDYPYLSANAELRKMISEHGALVSEYPPGTPPSKTSFPIRNRLISGLALGTVVVEASIKSGSLITADHALNQGKDVFAVPGNIMSAAYAGSNRLLRDGAKPVFSAADILSEYTSQYPHKINMDTAYTIIGEDSFNSPAGAVEPAVFKKNSADTESGENKTRRESLNSKSGYFSASNSEQKIKSDYDKSNNGENREYIKNNTVNIESFSENAVKVLDFLNQGEAVTDKIIEKTGLSAAEVLAAVTELEIMGAIEVLAGNICRIK
ncbi:MAG TPA: DNA-processing protein DprA [Firmicutes bacterium]|nr:DNA-processing protein DprA [Bacillota bacterium]